jgi:hypothetical protein
MFVPMGFIAGDRVAWHRWWFPDEATIAMSDGLLHDPSGEYTRYLNPGAARLDEYADCRGITLLADAGMGKSFELTAEIARRRAAGQHVARLDLGTYSSAGEVKDALTVALPMPDWRMTCGRCSLTPRRSGAAAKRRALSQRPACAN